jgi:lysophospholipase L1-like esterase
VKRNGREQGERETTRVMSTARRRSVVLIASVFVVAAVAVIGAGPVSAKPVTGKGANGTYLALGDSVAFGYQPPAAVPAPKYRDAHSFVGYPEFLAQLVNEHVANASCPGETSTSLLTGANSNGCEDFPAPSPVPPYRSSFPLHVHYKGTQMDYALKYLADHKHTHLITIDIGANDFFICVQQTTDGCTSPSEVSSLITQVVGNLAVTYAELHAAAPKATIVLLTYYSYDPSLDVATALLDGAMAAYAPGYVKIADGFAAFQSEEASLGHPDDPCGAGLLIKVSATSCDVHPTALGQRVLAHTIASVPGVQP